MDPKSSVPIAPYETAKTFGNQIGCIVRTFGNVNAEAHQSKENVPLATLLVEKLHARYKFPEDYDNTDLKTNPVNRLFLGKCNKATQTWRTALREMVKDGADFDRIHATWPSISEQDLADFNTAEEEEQRKKLREWGKDARVKNLAPHNLGSRGYAGKEKVWAKEDAERKGPNPYDKIKDPKMSRFIRAHYKKDPKNKGDLILNAKVKKLEKAYLEEEEKEEMMRAESDVGSSAVTKNPYDTPFLRAQNATKG